MEKNNKKDSSESIIEIKLRESARIHCMEAVQEIKSLGLEKFYFIDGKGEKVKVIGTVKNKDITKLLKKMKRIDSIKDSKIMKS